MSRSSWRKAHPATECQALEAEKAFLEGVNAEVVESSKRIQPIPSSLLNRMAHLRARAQANRERTEQLED